MRILNAYSLKNFYNSRKGRIVSSVLQNKIQDIWTDISPKRLLGYGYAIPYLSNYQNSNNCVFNLMSEQLGVHSWPVNSKNLVGLHQESDLPLETNSVDFVLMVHALEFLDDPEEAFAEIWRAMKSTGRLLIIVPNRVGFLGAGGLESFWAGATLFGAPS
jgi:SAM-dependent methyltransferase